MQNYSDDELRKILQHPHLLGHLAGKDKLTELHSEWIRYGWSGKDHVSLQAFRGSYKTTALTEIAPLIWLAKYPNSRIAIVKKTFTGAAESVRNMANMALLPDVYAFLEDFWGPWKFITLKDGKFLISAKETKTKELSVEGLGIDGSAIGRHYDVVIFDDIIDLEDRLSEAEREHTKIVTADFMSNIIDPGGFVGAWGTPWHPKDAWTILPTPLKYPLSKTPLLTQEEIDKKRKYTTEILWQINYELNFVSEQDMLFSSPYIGEWKEEQVTDIKAHLDAAYDGTHYCALTIMGRLPNNKFNAIGWVYAGNVKNWMQFIVKKMCMYKANKIYIETNADRGYTADSLRAFPEVKQNHIWIEDYDERMRKTEKIETYGYETYKDTEWAIETNHNDKPLNNEYMEQMIDYMPDQEPNDAPDSYASIIREGKYSITKSWQSNLWDFT